MRFLLRLYPRSWRDRYQDEFEAVLAQRQFRVADIVDLIRNALDARLHSYKGRDTMRDLSVRLAGVSLLVAGILWIVGVIDREGYMISAFAMPSAVGTLATSGVMRGGIPALLLLGIAGVWYRGHSSGRVTRPFSAAFARIEFDLAAYVLTWAAERFLRLPWYNSALRHGAIAFGLGCLCLAAVAVIFDLFRRRVLPAWSVFPLAIGMLGMAAFVATLLTSDSANTNQFMYQSQVYFELAFGLAWLPLGLALLRGGAASGERRRVA